MDRNKIVYRARGEVFADDGLEVNCEIPATAIGHTCIYQDGAFVVCWLEPVAPTNEEVRPKPNCVKDSSRPCVSWATCRMSEECYYDYQVRVANRGR